MTPLEQQVLAGLQELARLHGQSLAVTAERLLSRTQTQGQSSATSDLPGSSSAPEADRALTPTVTAGEQQGDLSSLSLEELLARIAERRERQAAYGSGSMTSQEALDLVREEMAGVR